MRLLRGRLASWGINPHKIGVIGFPADACLAADMSNTDVRAYPIANAVDRLSPDPISRSLPIPGTCWTTARAGTALSSSPG